ncbi:hypothetical protein TTHERM_00565620 (macronuclear) [Tetrahymena thermophila SB210]|uniref:Uncharacterized protein n=1 Tax=Tetrahymena thermophila (strain SB210) TaxID=312017 RepID=I7LWH6_TETTS|nr:hypothetical protein TTHERM_00565620 [Tetrahymena thermophila SB210]EAS01817.2 hypothetical protein TTHERM_00565620 [Tetrahymena thermophila SB210]|eukprot:XP_001022062.2 hypothetical protein TTHERM_00565620 [Tetrahymena thermophila SB210]
MFNSNKNMDKPKANKSIWQQTNNLSSKMDAQNQNGGSCGIIQQTNSTLNLVTKNNLDIPQKYEQIDLKDIGKIQLQRTAEDDEFSQILKCGKQNKVDIFQGSKELFKNRTWNLNSNNSIYPHQKISNDKNTCNLDEQNPFLTVRNINLNQNTYNLDHRLHQNYVKEQSSDQQNTDYIKTIDRSIDPFFSSAQYLAQLNQNIENGQMKFEKSLKSSAKKTDFTVLQFSSKFSTAQNHSPEFGNTELSFKNKKNNDQLKRNLALQDFDINKLTLEQFSAYQFSRNPFLSKDSINFEQSSLIKKAIPIEKCLSYKFLCEPCFELANNLSQDSIQSVQNEQTIKSKSKYHKIQKSVNQIADCQTTEKKLIYESDQNDEEQNYYQKIQSIRSKLSCFCQNGMVGEEEFFKKLEEIHLSKIVKRTDISNYYRFLVWRLSFKQKLSIESLYYHLEKRIYMQKKLNFQPFLEKYLSFLEIQNKQKQTDQIANNKIQQEYAQIQDNLKLNSIEIKQFYNYPNQIILLIGEILETSRHYVIEFTDAWSSLYFIINKSLNIKEQPYHHKSLSLSSQDEQKGKNIGYKKNTLKMTNQQLFEDLIQRKKIKPQTKVRISNLQFLFQQKIKIQQDCGEIREFDHLIQIPFNSFQKEKNKQTKLGYFNKPFLRSLSSIKPKGEQISTLDLVILKKYPLLVQYHLKQQKKTINFCEAVNSSVINKANSNDFFYAKYLVCDSLFIYDQSQPISNQPQTELIIQFADSNSYSEMREGTRIRVRNAYCTFYDIQNHYLSGYTITLKAEYKNVMHQERFLTKQDFSRSKQFYQSAVKAFAQSKTIEDYSKFCNLNYLETLDFDLSISYRSYSQNNNSIIGEISYYGQPCECEIITHNSFFKTKLLSFEKYQTLRLLNVHLKCYEVNKKKFIFKTSYNTFIQC